MGQWAQFVFENKHREPVRDLAFGADDDVTPHHPEPLDVRVGELRGRSALAVMVAAEHAAKLDEMLGRPRQSDDSQRHMCMTPLVPLVGYGSR